MACRGEMALSGDSEQIINLSVVMVTKEDWNTAFWVVILVGRVVGLAVSFSVSFLRDPVQCL